MRNIHTSTFPGIAWIVALALSASACATTQSGGQNSLPPEVVRQAETKRDLGMDHLANGRLALSIRELMASVEIDPSDHETHLWLGEAYRRKNMLELAEEHLLLALEIDPTYHATRVNLAALYIQMERYDESVALSQEVVADPTFPTPWKALTNQAWAEYSKGDLPQARLTLERALDFHPRFWPAILNMGIVDADEGRRLEAIERFLRVIELDPGRRASAEANYRIAQTFVAMGHRSRAVRHFTAVLESSPDGEWGELTKRYMKLLR